VPPLDAKPAASAEEVEVLLSEFCRTHERGYLRLNLDYRASDLNLRRVVYPLLEATNNEVRYNPNAIWQNRTEVDGGKTAPVFEVTELSQMTNPLEFVLKTIEHYPSLNPDTLEADFAEIEKELMVELCVPQS
jgi:exonuclease SbcD